ncbi:hypothetical protein CYMTET_49555 [Cymbomonas tetramitiformis]|uniref:Uncharacterized protein n=1 Tax=Cymbomonas tetramitiformis TaxID=36881 RepID=A0AAE0BR35_9CHLO|nr:hypothetical protein CYMTET_49555 [Cymbomonas tetramitiformis]
MYRYTVAECKAALHRTWELNFLNAHSRGRWRRPYLKRRMSPERPTTNISESFEKKPSDDRQDEKELLREARKPTKLCLLDHRHRQHEGQAQVAEDALLLQRHREIKHELQVTSVHAVRHWQRRPQGASLHPGSLDKRGVVKRDECYSERPL